MANPLDKFKKIPQTNDIRLPEMPKLLDAVQASGLMNGLTKHAEDMELWRQQAERVLNERLSQQVAATTATATTTTPVASTPAPVSQPTPAPAQDNTALNNHIKAKTAHGTGSEIVGVSDEQDLESKTIGLTQPRYGRFTHIIQADEVTVDETLEIPIGCNIVVASLTVNGVLQVDGRLITV